MFKKSALFLFALLQLHASIFDWFGPSLTAKAKHAQSLVEGFDSLVLQALEDFKVPGIAIAVVVDGQPIYEKGFGWRDLEKGLPVTPETIFAIGSCTKAFTSFVIGSLVDEGLLTWDQLVVDLLPKFRLSDAYITQNLKIRDLLTHRCGMPRHDYLWYNSSLTRPEIMQRLRFLDLSCDLRERYQYNNLMYLTAGCVAEKVVGNSWEEIVTDRILRPLEMEHTTFSVVESQKMSDFAYPYLEKEGALKRIPFRDISVMGPAGGINSNISDLSHWLIMQLNGGYYGDRFLIGPAALQEMHAPQMIVNGMPDVKENLLCSYGMGWKISSYRGNYYVYHEGGIDGFTSIVGLLPNENMGVVLLANKNLTSLASCLAFQIIDRILELPFINWIQEGLDAIQKQREMAKESRVKEDLLRRKNTLPSHSLEEYVGDYFHPGYGKLSVTLAENGKLEATFNGITSFLDHWHYDVFVIEKEDQDLILPREGMKFAFRTNVEGEVKEVVIPFEENTDPIVFQKQIQTSLYDLNYLRQFVGFYEIYGYTVEVALRNQSLCAIIPGQPLYELTPINLHEFAVKSMTGYQVRFMLNDLGKVEEVLLIQPYGSLSAKPKLAMGMR